MTPGLAAKQPKVVAGSVSVLKDMVRYVTTCTRVHPLSQCSFYSLCRPSGRLFGPKTINLKPILPLLPKIFAHADKTVRAEGTGLALALHGYLGPALDSHLSELKPVQVKELGEAFVEADGKGEGFGGLKQSRFTRSQQRERDVKEAEVALEGNAPGEEGTLRRAARAEGDAWRG